MGSRAGGAWRRQGRGGLTGWKRHEISDLLSVALSFNTLCNIWHICYKNITELFEYNVSQPLTPPPIPSPHSPEHLLKITPPLNLTITSLPLRASEPHLRQHNRPAPLDLLLPPIQPHLNLLLLQFPLQQPSTLFDLRQNLLQELLGVLRPG